MPRGKAPEKIYVNGIAYNWILARAVSVLREFSLISPNFWRHCFFPPAASLWISRSRLTIDTHARARARVQECSYFLMIATVFILYPFSFQIENIKNRLKECTPAVSENAMMWILARKIIYHIVEGATRQMVEVFIRHAVFLQSARLMMFRKLD